MVRTIPAIKAVYLHILCDGCGKICGTINTTEINPGNIISAKCADCTPKPKLRTDDLRVLYPEGEEK